MSSAPIGVFDSGIGGLSVLRHLHRLLPCEDLIYVADSAHAPYGDRSPHEIQARAEEITRFLTGQGCKLVVMACNTATAAAAGTVRAASPVPVIGVEPGVKPAAMATRNGVVGILATRGTLQSAKYGHLVNRFGREITLISQICDGLADQVEAGQTTSPATRSLLRRYLAPIMERGADTLALGCTHYPFLIPLIREILGPGVTIIDTGGAVARQALRQLREENLHPDTQRHGGLSVFTSGDRERVARQMEAFWEGATDLHPLPSIAPPAIPFQAEKISSPA
ncbi:MAG: glutamate racemase [Candidatus Sedimenticola endophacoides]